MATKYQALHNEDSPGLSGETTEEIFDETGADITQAYAHVIHEMKNSPDVFTRNLMRYMEIRSWTHLNCPALFNRSRTNWAYYQEDPLMGMGQPHENPLFEWCMEEHQHWQVDHTISSYFFPEFKYKLLTRLDQARCSTTLGLSGDGGKHVSTGIILTNSTDNPDGAAGRILYVAFRETTSFLQGNCWNFFSWERVEKYPGNQILDRYVNNGDHYDLTPGVNVMGGLWYGAYCSNDRGNERNSIRQQLLQFTTEYDLSNFDRVILLGVSLGAALSQCAALDLSIRMEVGRVKLVLFASPRVGCDRFVQVLRDRKVECVRIEAGVRDDVIGFPLPFRLFSIRWRHAGIAVRFPVDPDDMVTDLGQGVVAPSVLRHGVLYIGRDPVYKWIPTRLRYRARNVNNFHTRANYFKWIFSFYVKYNKIGSPAHGFYWE